MSSPSPSSGRRRVKKRILLPLILLALLLLFFVGVYVRGTWADAEPRNPRHAADGPLTQLYRVPQGDIQVRCAVLIEAPAARVWAVVRAYPDHARFLPYVSALEAVPEAGDRVFLKGTAHSRLWGDWPFAVHVDHKAEPDKKYTASWDEPGEAMPVNRGSWTVTATGPNESLVVFALQVEADGYPTFLIRNVLLDRVAKVVAGLRDEVKRRQAEAPKT